MSKVLAVFGATGNQGSSVVDHVLKHPQLSKEFSIRAITRNVDSPAAKDLKARNVDVVSGDLSDRASLDKALNGVHTVFLVNAPVFGPDGFDTEYKLITSAVDAAVDQGVSYLIFSTLPSVTEMTKGKVTIMSPFDAKAAAEKYIRSSPIASAFVAGAFFFENFHAQQLVAGVKKVPDTDEYVLQRPSAPDAKLQYIDARADLGKYVTTILSAPDTYKGVVLYAAERAYSFAESAEILSKATGKTVRYEQVGVKELKETLPVPEGPMRDLVAEVLTLAGEIDIFGEGTEEKVRWGREQVGERLGTMEEYFERVPYVLP
ncbi:NAD(P)-binding protein [Phaeosphaeriaceae sp. SRC1lsM3a]|nr:NAD(P)-binding protein [Stagonospora sp. SRC1lsM3a]